ncbi:MAG: hypothetical protein ACO331_12595 [Prochlorothrix sp.]
MKKELESPTLTGGSLCPIVRRVPGAIAAVRHPAQPNLAPPIAPIWPQIIHNSE